MIPFIIVIDYFLRGVYEVEVDILLLVQILVLAVMLDFDLSELFVLFDFFILLIPYCALRFEVYKT